MAVKTFTTETLTSADTNEYLANSGLVYVTSATVGTGASSVTVSSAFNSTYDNYVIIYTGGVNSVNCGLSVALGSATTQYYNTLIYGSYAGTGPSFATTNNNRVAWAWAGGGSPDAMFLNVTLLSPFATKFTRIMGQTYDGVDNAGAMQGIHKIATSYTAFTIITDAGTMTGGTVTVYGYRKA
jgi:hypothetical protein